MQDINNTTKTEFGVEVYESDIDLALDTFIQNNDVEDMRKETQSFWNAALIDIHKQVFHGTNILKKLNEDNQNLKNAYDLQKVNDVLDIYINLCYKYDKEISILGFCKLTGINKDTIYEWNSIGVGEGPGSISSEIYKKLNVEREESLSNRLISSKGNPVGILGILNRHYGWNMGQPNDTGYEKKTRSIDEIQQQYSAPELSQKDTQISLPKAEF